MQIGIMTNIGNSYYVFIHKTAEKEGKTKRSILEEALTLYMQQKEKKAYRKEMEEGYKKLGEDKEYLEEMRKTAEIGMDAYWETIKDNG
jgi:hypothetical protein